MIIVDRKTFLGMPTGTVFLTELHGDIKVLTHTYENDFDYVSASGFMSTSHDDVVDSIVAMEKGDSVDMGLFGERDGLYDEKQKYYVLSKPEIRDVISLLVEALSDLK